MHGEGVGGSALAGRPPGEDAPQHSGSGPGRHDPVAALVAKLAEAANSGDGSSLGQRATVKVRRLRQGLYRVGRS